MKKEIKNKFGHKYYLLGVHNNKKVWLEEAEFECGWYWGVGYIAIFNSTYTDINECTHFDYLFFNRGKDCCTLFDEYFDDIVLTEENIWKLLELMKSLYTMRNYSDMLYLGGSNIMKNPLKDIIKCDAEYQRINKTVIPQINKEIYKMLSPK